LPVAIKKYATSKINSGLKKFQPTFEEANPNRKFVLNSVIAVLENDKVRKNHTTKRGLLWSDYPGFLKKLYTDLQSRPFFVNYMENEKSSWQEDVDLLYTFFETELEDNEELYEILEDQSIYWADDLSYVLGVVLKMLSCIKEETSPEHLEMFRQPEDREYAQHLLEHSLLHYDEYLALLRTFAHNWEVDRMAATDICLIVLGISEAICCPTIPVKVTINEVVELAKYYSTPNSKLFVNGILDKIIQHLKEEGKIIKEGRGLIDNNKPFNQ
jgi:N utilization substance protein B